MDEKNDDGKKCPSLISVLGFLKFPELKEPPLQNETPKIEEINQFPFDCIISRALASLEKLLEYSLKLLNKDGYCLFLKGKNFESELQDAKKIFNFDYILHQSITSNVSYIVEISNITKGCL